MPFTICALRQLLYLFADVMNIIYFPRSIMLIPLMLTIERPPHLKEIVLIKQERNNISYTLNYIIYYDTGTSEIKLKTSSGLHFALRLTIDLQRLQRNVITK